MDILGNDIGVNSSSGLWNLYGEHGEHGGKVPSRKGGIEGATCLPKPRRKWTQAPALKQPILGREGKAPSALLVEGATQAPV